MKTDLIKWLLDESVEVKTDFPAKGDDKEITLSGSRWKVFDPQYAKDLKDNWPDIWNKGGNIRGNQQFQLLYPVWQNEGKPDSDEGRYAVKLRESWTARHRYNKRINGVVALIKWLSVGDIGEAAMKQIVDALKNKKKD